MRGRSTDVTYQVGVRAARPLRRRGRGQGSICVESCYVSRGWAIPRAIARMCTRVWVPLGHSRGERGFAQAPITRGRCASQRRPLGAALGHKQPETAVLWPWRAAGSRRRGTVRADARPIGGPITVWRRGAQAYLANASHVWPRDSRLDCPLASPTASLSVKGCSRRRLRRRGNDKARTLRRRRPRPGCVAVSAAVTGVLASAAAKTAPEAAPKTRPCVRYASWPSSEQSTSRDSSLGGTDALSPRSCISRSRAFRFISSTCLLQFVFRYVAH